MTRFNSLKNSLKIKNIGLFVNTTKANAAGVVEGVSVWLEERGIVPLLSEEEAIALGQPQTGISKILGGDGTLLSAAHTPKIENVPTLSDQHRNAWIFDGRIT